jgi:hypothetical protein
MMVNFIKKINNKLRILNSGFTGGVRYTKSHKVNLISSTLNSNLKSYCDDINLPNFWSDSNALEIEIKKCTIRGALRYSNSGMQLAKSVANQFKEDKFILFYTPIYPLIHLSGDESERGSMHIDQIKESKMLTAWTPITEYAYDGLSIYNFSSKYTSLLTYFNEKYLKLLESTLSPKLGTTISWGATFPHRGNLNTSNYYSCACVIRISEEPLMYEPYRNLHNASGGRENELLEDSFDINEVYNILLLCINFSKINYKKTINKEFLGEIFDLKKSNSIDPKTDKILSFSLSVLLQRLKAIDSTMKKNNHLINTSILEIMSLFYGGQNLWFLPSLMKEINQQKNGKKIFKEIENYLVEFPCYNSKNWEILTSKTILTKPYWKF